MTNYTDIIERLEKATGADRYEDFLIDIALRGWRNLGGGRCEVIATKSIVDTPNYSPPYTASIEAALTLVPEGWAWKVGTCCVSDDAWVAPDYNSPIHGERLRKELGEPVYGSIWDCGIDVDLRPSGRVAIALCIAALKARAAMAGEG